MSRSGFAYGVVTAVSPKFRVTTDGDSTHSAPAIAAYPSPAVGDRVRLELHTPNRSIAIAKVGSSA